MCCRWDHNPLKTESHLWAAALLTFSCTGKVKKKKKSALFYICSDLFSSVYLWGCVGKLLQHPAIHIDSFDKKRPKITKAGCQFSCVPPGRPNIVQNSLHQCEFCRHVMSPTFGFLPGLPHRRHMWNYHNCALSDVKAGVDTAVMPFRFVTTPWNMLAPWSETLSQLPRWLRDGQIRFGGELQFSLSNRNFIKRVNVLFSTDPLSFWVYLVHEPIPFKSRKTH